MTVKRKMFEAESRNINDMYVSVYGTMNDVKLRNNNETVTVVSALNKAPDADEVINLNDFFTIDMFDFRDAFEIGKLQEIARGLIANQVLNDNIRWIRIPLEKSTYTMVERSKDDIDKFDFTKLSFSVKAKEYTTGNAYVLNAPLPVLVRVVDNNTFINKVNNKITSVDRRAFNNSMLVPAFITFDNISRSLVGREILLDSYINLRNEESTVTLDYSRLYIDGNVRVRCANGVILSEMRTVTSRKEEVITISNAFETRFRAVA